MGMPYIILIIYLAVALALQFLMGNIPFSFLAFPLNMILALIWAGGMIALWRTERKSLFVDFMLSKGATVSSIVLFLGFSTVIGITGERSLVSTWVFAAVMLYFQTVLLFVLLRGWRAQTSTGARLGSVRWRFLLNHLGLLLAVSSAFWGAPDTEVLRIRAVRDLPVREAYSMDGRSAWLPFEITLDEFKVETYENGVPSMYEAKVKAAGKDVILKVNSPYNVSFGKDLYLVGFDGMDSTGSCILQIVYEPWRYAALAGVIMMLMGAFLLFIAGPRRLKDEE
jgi:hypothetical protein